HRAPRRPAPLARAAACAGMARPFGPHGSGECAARRDRPAASPRPRRPAFRPARRPGDDPPGAAVPAAPRPRGCRLSPHRPGRARAPAGDRRCPLRRPGDGRRAAGQRCGPASRVPRCGAARDRRGARDGAAAGHRLRGRRHRCAARACAARVPAQARAARLMGFLVPALLALAAAAVVPIVLHLLQRHQGPRVVFPALRYLRRAEKESARQIRLRQLLLLLLRVAALLLLALAAAQPFIRGAGASHEPSAVAIILDNSLSSGTVSNDRRVLDDLKARALETLERAGPDDRFWLLRAGAPWEPALPGDAETTAARVRETEPTAAASDLAAAVTHAAALLATGAEGRAREIQILSDAQASAFRGPVEALDDDVEVVIRAQGEAPPN